MPEPPRAPTPSVQLASAARRVFREAVMCGKTSMAVDSAQLLLGSGTGLDELYSGILQPLLEEIGTAWQRGEIRMADEHRCSTTVRALVTELATARRRIASPRGSVLLLPASGEQHVLGLMMVEHALHDTGWRVERVDALPLAEIPGYVASMPDLALIGISLHTIDTPEPLRRELTALRRALPAVPVLLGGLAVRRDPTLGERVGTDGAAGDVSGAVRLADELTNPLTPRERTVLHLVSLGRTNEKIAGELGIQVPTVKTHLERVYAKLGVRDRAASAAVAIRRGWIR